MSLSKTEEGKKFENLAREFLIEKEYEVLATNYRFHKKEIDIIVRKENIIAFVEVKYRRRNLAFNPFASISKAKIANIKTCATDYLFKHKEYQTHYCRFDAIVIVTESDNGETVINHFPGAFR